MALVAFASILLGLTPPVMAQESPPVTAVGRLGQGSVGVGLGAPGGLSQPATGTNTNTGGSSGGTQVIPVSTNSGSGGSQQAAPPPITWTRHYYGDPGYSVNSPIVCTTSTGQNLSGRAYEDVGIDRATGQVVARQTGCENPAAPTQPGAGTNTTTPPPPPPTPAEIWARVPLPIPVLGLNPSINGLTGLPTWLWDPNPGQQTATVNLRGYTAQAAASPVRWEWKMWQNGDTPNVNPDPVVVATKPGSEAAPAATYTYETNGDYTVTATVTWSGTYTYTGPGTPATTVNLGTTTKTSTQSYHVISVRGARVG